LRLAPRKPKMRRQRIKVLRFKDCWLRDRHIIDAVKEGWNNEENNIHNKIFSCVKDLTGWGKDKFGDIPKQIVNTKKRLDELNGRSRQDGIITEIRRQEVILDDLLESEEIWCAQRLRAMWLKHGDKNTSFFHRKASKRKARNWVERTIDDHGEVFTDEEEIARVLNNFFHELFTSSNPERIDEAVNVVQNQVVKCYA